MAFSFLHQIATPIAVKTMWVTNKDLSRQVTDKGCLRSIKPLLILNTLYQIKYVDVFTVQNRYVTDLVFVTHFRQDVRRFGEDTGYLFGS